MTHHSETVPGNGRNGSRPFHPTLWVSAAWEYALVTTVDWRPVIAQRPRFGSDDDWVTHDLSGTRIGLIEVTDSHCAVSLCVDADGYIHVSGNGHDNIFPEPGLRYVRSAVPHDISSWVSGAAPPGWTTIGRDRTTYSCYDGFSDGTVLWSISQNDSSKYPTGRDWTLWRKPPGAAGWLPCLASGGEIMTAENHPNNYPGYDFLPPGTNQSNVDAIPDRSYVLNVYVDRHDVLHLFAVWRVSATVLVDHREAFYVRSHDQGATWENVYGEAVDAPFTHPKTLDGAAGSAPARITVDGYPVYMLVGGNCALDAAGRIHATFGGAGGRHLWHDGSEWRMESLAEHGWPEPPAITFTRSTLWMWGGYFQGGDRSLYGTNWTTRVPRTVRVGACPPTGTPDGVYQFENGAFYHPAVTHAGGLSDSGRPITRIMLPDGDSPRIFTLGAGAVHRTARVPPAPVELEPAVRARATASSWTAVSSGVLHVPRSDAATTGLLAVMLPVATTVTVTGATVQTVGENVQNGWRLWVWTTTLPAAASDLTLTFSAAATALAAYSGYAGVVPSSPTHRSALGTWLPNGTSRAARVPALGPTTLRSLFVKACGATYTTYPAAFPPVPERTVPRCDAVRPVAGGHVSLTIFDGERPAPAGSRTPTEAVEYPTVVTTAVSATTALVHL